MPVFNLSVVPARAPVPVEQSPVRAGYIISNDEDMRVAVIKLNEVSKTNISEWRRLITRLNAGAKKSMQQLPVWGLLNAVTDILNYNYIFYFVEFPSIPETARRLCAAIRIVSEYIFNYDYQESTKWGRIASTLYVETCWAAHAPNNGKNRARHSAEKLGDNIKIFYETINAASIKAIISGFKEMGDLITATLEAIVLPELAKGKAVGASMEKAEAESKGVAVDAKAGAGTEVEGNGKSESKSALFPPDASAVPSGAAVATDTSTTTPVDTLRLP